MVKAPIRTPAVGAAEDRLVSMLPAHSSGYAEGVPSVGMMLALGMELVVTPGLCWWQGRVASADA